MKEQSHKDEMSAALRGDFARLRDRGVAVTLARPASDSPTAAPEPVSAASEPEPEPERVAEEPPASAPGATTEPEPGVDPAQAAGWLDRLLGR